MTDDRSSAPGYVTCNLADVPADDGWLSEAERAVLSALRVPYRSSHWRLGRFTAKAAVGAFRELPASSVEVLAAADGAPEARSDAAPLGISLSLSHRAGRGLAVVWGGAGAIGCDLELTEPRSAAFVRHWLAPAEQELLAAARGERRPLLANLLWSAKEAAAKARRQGLRLDVRGAVVDLAGCMHAQGWKPLTVNWGDEGGSTGGWWHEEPGWVITVAGEPAPMAPLSLTAVEQTRELQARSGSSETEALARGF
jgi:4'-phosphopantetheinyl transferase